MNLSQYFLPRLIDALRGYNKTRLSTDITALPLVIAFAIASGWQSGMRIK
ncbi:MAG: hypothetical protein WCA63_01275 [Gallionella sp.]